MATTALDRGPDLSVALAPPAEWPDEYAATRRGLARRLWICLRAWRAQRETLRQLHALDHTTLRDLGIAASEIESFVQGGSKDRIRGYDRNWWRK